MFQTNKQINNPQGRKQRLSASLFQSSETSYNPQHPVIIILSTLSQRISVKHNAFIQMAMTCTRMFVVISTVDQGTREDPCHWPRAETDGVMVGWLEMFVGYQVPKKDRCLQWSANFVTYGSDKITLILFTVSQNRERLAKELTN